MTTRHPRHPHVEVNDSWNVMIGLDVNKMSRIVNAELGIMETSCDWERKLLRAQIAYLLSYNTAYTN